MAINTDLFKALQILKDIRDATKRIDGKRHYMVTNISAFDRAVSEGEQLLDDHRFELEQKPQS